MMTMFDTYRSAVQIFPITGSIYSFISDDFYKFQQGDTTMLHWDVETGPRFASSRADATASAALEGLPKKAFRKSEF